MSRRKSPAAEAQARRLTLHAAAPPSARARQLAGLLAGGEYKIETGGSVGAEDIALWTDGTGPERPLPPTALSVVDLHGRVEQVAPGCRLLLAGSEAERGYWSRVLEAAGRTVPIAVVRFTPKVAKRGGPRRFDALWIVQGEHPSDATLDMVRRAAAWAELRGIRAGVADGTGPAGLLGKQLAGPAPALGAGVVAFDARAGDAGELVATPAALVEAVASGAPVLGCAETAMLALLRARGAGRLLEEVETGLDRFMAQPQAALEAMSEAAMAFARDWCDEGEAKAALLGAIERAVAERQRVIAAWMQPCPGQGQGGHVLVISDEALNLVDIRVHLPFDTLQRRGAISGYTILRHGEFAYSTTPVTPELTFDMIWAHRSVDPGLQLLLRTLGRPFIYDVDDNLLVSPAYRTAFPAETIETARALMGGCAVLSCATPALFELLQKRSDVRLAGKAVLTPNLAHGAPPAPKPGPPEAVVWASSDKPALTGSRPEIERAVRDFCLAHGLRLVFMGAEPPKLLAESAVEIEHIGLLSYQGYLSRLRGLAPGILVGPLETGADPATQDFVDGKSDVKVMEARLAGLVGVFSRAVPYEQSDLAPPILCENTYAAWLDGLERAYRLCLAPSPAPSWPPARAAEQLGPMGWAEALARGRLGARLSAGEVMDAVQFVREQQESLLGSPEAFDEAYYLGRHEDVRLAIEQRIVPSGYYHYVNSGYHERRAARRKPSAKGASDLWWGKLLQTVGRLEREVAAGDEAIEALRSRVALRRTQPRRAPKTPEAAPAPPPTPAHPKFDLVWHPPGAVVDQPCPVCDAPGPHPVLLVAEGHTLVKCRRCASCFYERRVVYNYEREKSADVLIRLYLEQNASIYHQTRFLFAIDDPKIDSVLDVGCGFGYPVDLAAKVLGWRATGIDPSFYAREGAALLKADIRKEYLTEATELGEPYALVMASEVIEHVPDPYAFLALFRRWLRPGGTLVLTTPDAAALEPGIGPGSLIGILSLNVHLMLFTKDSLGTALRRAGFRHVQVESAQDTLIAYASDQPLRFRDDAAERHVQTYKRYLEHLVETAEPGGALWNGAAGRLFQLIANSADLPTLHALFARIAGAWRDRFGIDLARLKLPPMIPERAFQAGDRSATTAGLVATQPINLPGVLYARAMVEDRTPGRTAEAVLGYARAAYQFAVQTRRILEAEDMVDLDLKMTAWRARLMMIDCLAELAPEVEGEMLRGLAELSPGALHDRVDLPAEALVRRITPFFSRSVHADRFDEARRVEKWMRNLDLICASCADEPERLFRGLFTVGVLRLVAEGRPDAALEAFERMEAETRRRLHDPVEGARAREFFRVAQEHVRLAAERLAPQKDPA